MTTFPKVELQSATRKGDKIYAISAYELLGLKFDTVYEFEIRSDGWYWVHHTRSAKYNAILESEKKNVKLSKETIEKIQELLNKEVERDA